MRRLRDSFALALAVTALAAGAQPADGQGMLKRIKDGAKQQIEQKTAEKVGQAIDQAVDGKSASAPVAQADDATQNPASAAASAPAATASGPAAERPGEGAWANYDFVPGERVIFVDDFSRDNVGDFPRRLEFRQGNMEVVDWKGARWLRASGGAGRFAIPLPESLPERFTIEFDYAGWNKYELKLEFEEHRRDDGNSMIGLGSWGAGVQGGGVKAMGRPRSDIEKRGARVRIMVDGRYAKVYIDEHRVANVPNATLPRPGKIWVEVPAHGEDVVGLIGDIQIMAGGRKLYDAIAAEGRVATQGILFDTGSDRIRAESTPTLKEIAAMLKEHPELKLRIEGHTDNVGQAASNQALSQKRAEAVKQQLIAAYGVDAGRLEAQGLGPSKPAGSNDTAEGRQQNRRVELVRL
jgi:OmpA-OmpF porin, OOP family